MDPSAARARAGLTVLAWSPRVAPGLLTAPAWDLLRGADGVWALGADHPLAASAAQAGVAVRVLDVTPWSATAAASRLLDLARDARVVWLPSADGDPELLAALRAGAGSRAVPSTVEVVEGSHDLPGAAVLDLVAVMDRLRSPGGCPWDAEQTHASLLTYLVEETYETVEAVETGDSDDLREELGDLLLQVVFHARIGEEDPAAPWGLDDVARGITAKLVRRHPHVFGPDAEAAGGPEGGAGVRVGDLDARWDALKAAEKNRSSATDGVPFGQPALSLAAKLHDRAARAGAAPAPAALPPAVARAAADDVSLGDLLLAVVVAARGAGLDPEAALRAAARRYAAGVRALEAGRG